MPTCLLGWLVLGFGIAALYGTLFTSRQSLRFLLVCLVLVRSTYWLVAPIEYRLCVLQADYSFMVQTFFAVGKDDMALATLVQAFKVCLQQVASYVSMTDLYVELFLALPLGVVE